MLKIEKTVTASPEQWEIIIEGMRNPKNSWDKIDSYIEYIENPVTGNRAPWQFHLGENDEKLMKSLRDGGPVHAKYRRMIPVHVTLTAPVYWFAELDTYKIGTTRNSGSFMHKGVSRPFEITDFSIKNEQVYEVLSSLKKREYKLHYPYETDEFKTYTDIRGYTYRVYKNGHIIREAFDYTDTWGTGRTRHFEEADAKVWQNRNGYFVVKMAGRNSDSMMLHRMVAELWCDKKEGCEQVNHIDGDKGNNCAENLEWVTPGENIRKAYEAGLYTNNSSLHKRYKLWKYRSEVIPAHKRMEFRMDIARSLSTKELAIKYGIEERQVYNLRYDLSLEENEDLYAECYAWEKMIDNLNALRAEYLETRDEQIFQELRGLLPSGYMQHSTLCLNYEVLANIYKWRKHHRLDEWRAFCDWIETLPYSYLITGDLEEQND